MVRPLEDIRQRGGTRIFMATTATRIAIMPTILATTPTILSTPPWLATGTITALAGRGEVTTRSQLVEPFDLDSGANHEALAPPVRNFLEHRRHWNRRRGPKLSVVRDLQRGSGRRHEL